MEQLVLGQFWGTDVIPGKKQEMVIVVMPDYCGRVGFIDSAKLEYMTPEMFKYKYRPFKGVRIPQEENAVAKNKEEGIWNRTHADAGSCHYRETPRCTGAICGAWSKRWHPATLETDTKCDVCQERINERDEIERNKIRLPPGTRDVIRGMITALERCLKEAE